MLSEQVTSDPDEPFFILSLTEIPVRSSGQEVDSAGEPLPYLSLADASIQQHRFAFLSASHPGEHGDYFFVWYLTLRSFSSSPLSSDPGEEGSLPTVSDLTAYIVSEVVWNHSYLQCHKNVSICQTFSFIFLFIHTRNQSQRIQWIHMVERLCYLSSLKTIPVVCLIVLDVVFYYYYYYLAESTATVQPSTSAETVEKTEETEIPSEQRPAGAARIGRQRINTITISKVDKRISSCTRISLNQGNQCRSNPVLQGKKHPARAELQKQTRTLNFLWFRCSLKHVMKRRKERKRSLLSCRKEVVIM